MKKYNKPTIQVVELSVKESLSDIPAKFGGRVTMGKLTGSAYKNLSIYRKSSAVVNNG